MNDVTNEETTTSKRVVKLTDGTVYDFGPRDNLTIRQNTADGDDRDTITIFIFSGEAIRWKPFESPYQAYMKDAPEFCRKINLSGLCSRLRTNTAATPLFLEEDVKETSKDEQGNDVTTVVGKRKVHKLAEVIMANIKAIDSGKFTIRGSSSDVAATLSIMQKAYAMVLAKYNPATRDQYAHFVDNLDDQEVIDEVLELWKAKSKSDIAEIRANPFVQMEIGRLKTDGVAFTGF